MPGILPVCYPAYAATIRADEFGWSIDDSGLAYTVGAGRALDRGFRLLWNVGSPGSQPLGIGGLGRYVVNVLGVAFLVIQPACFTSRKVNPYLPAELSEQSDDGWRLAAHHLRAGCVLI